MTIETDEISESEVQPLLSPSPSPSSLHPIHTHANGLWSFCTEGTRIYIIILISQCFIAASDSPFKASLTRLHKFFLCCQQDPTRCHDRQWCEVESGNATERELSDIYRWQAIFNAVGGAISICVWYWGVWPWLQRRQLPGQRDMTGPLRLSQFGVLILEVVNALVAYGIQNNAVSATLFKYLVICAPSVSFLIGGGPATYWAFRENIIAVAVGPAPKPARNVSDHGSSDASRDEQVMGHDRNRPLHLDDRRTAYFTLALFSTVAQWISAILTREFIVRSSTAGSAHLLCLLGGLGSSLLGILALWLLPKIPLPSTDRPLTNGRPTISPKPGTTSALFIAFLVLSNIARSPLASSVSSSFAVRYISRRLSFDTSDAVVLINLANIAPPLLGLAWSLASNRKYQSPKRSSPTSTQPLVRFPKVLLVWAIIPLFIAVIGTVMMAISSSFVFTQTYLFVLTAILLICLGSWYTLFTEPILGGLSTEEKKPWVFVAQQVVFALFSSLGAYFLNWGFQLETDEGQQPHNPIGWTYLGITGLCVVALFCLMAAWLSSHKKGETLEDGETERDATVIQG